MVPNALNYAIGYVVITGIISWLLGDDDDDDELVLEAHDIVLDALSDADRTEVTEVVTGRNWRDVEQAEELNKERELRKMGKRRN